MFDEIRNQLLESVDDKYRNFNRSLVPGEIAPMIGVRMPKLREIAKQIARENGREYIREVKEAEVAGDVLHEELLLHGIVIGYLKCDIEERMELLDAFVPVINNWAVCDCSCMTYKFMKKDAEIWFAYLLKHTESEREYEIRFAVVSMLAHFVTEPFVDRVLEVMNNLHHEGYYVKMAAAWAVSVCFVKFPERTKLFLQDNEMDDFTQNKSIQKIRESYRVSREDKELIMNWKR